MFKNIVLALALFSVVWADTTFEAVPKGTNPFYAARSEGEVSYSVGYSASSADIFVIPKDNGGNWGDNLWKNRVPGDVLLTREIQINPIKLAEDQQFNWSANFPKNTITHIRFLNIGRERAFVEKVSSAGTTTASAIIRVAPGAQFRLLIEVYVK